MKGMRLPGPDGQQPRDAARASTVVDVDSERNLLIVRGAVPGPEGALVEVRDG